jgi:hypothetical protein
MTSNTNGTASNNDEAVEKKQPMGWVELNSDKTKRQLVKTSDIEWVGASQAGGVYRKMIERRGGEVARATTVVKFDPDQSFPRHTHAGGEEFVVLDGVWRDDYGSFGKYSYIRNYIGSGHTPSIGPEGCIILVKLRQMSVMSNDEPEHRNWPDLDPESVWNQGKPYSNGLAKQTKLPLFSNELEQTAVHVWAKNSTIELEVPPRGIEIFVVDGTFSSDMGAHDKWSWCRLPNDSQSSVVFKVQTCEDDVYIWTKEGHLESDEVGVE